MNFPEECEGKMTRFSFVAFTTRIHIGMFSSEFVECFLRPTLVFTHQHCDKCNYRKISHIADAVAEGYAAMSEIAMCELGFNTKTLKWGKLFSKVHF